MAPGEAMLILLIKAVHTVLFLLITGCMLYLLYCGIANRLSRWTLAALAVVVVHGVVLTVSGWTCPLTIWAHRLGAANGGVSDLFLPRWLADNLWAIYRPAFAAICLLLLIRVLLNRRSRSPS